MVEYGICHDVLKACLYRSNKKTVDTILMTASILYFCEMEIARVQKYDSKSYMIHT